MDSRLYFLSGMPRSGSTVLSALLKQHPKIYVSPTSPLSELVSVVEKTWLQLDSQFTMPYPNHTKDLSFFMMHGFYSSVDRPIIFDKSRSWPSLVPGLLKVFEEPPKIICTVRDISEVLSSFYRLYPWGQTQPNYIEVLLFQRGLENTGFNRLKILWETMVKPSWDSLRFGLEQAPHCIHLVEYKDLLTHKQQCLDGIYKFCGIDPICNDFDNISIEKEEIDEKWGIDELHTIRPKLERREYQLTGINDDDLSRFKNLKLEFWRSI